MIALRNGINSFVRGLLPPTIIENISIVIERLHCACAGVHVPVLIWAKLFFYV